MNKLVAIDNIAIIDKKKLDLLVDDVNILRKKYDIIFEDLIK